MMSIIAPAPVRAQDTVVVWTREEHATDTARLCNTLLIAELDASGFMIQSMDSEAPPDAKDLSIQTPDVFAWIVILANEQSTTVTLFIPAEASPEQLTEITLRRARDARPTALQLTELLRARQEAIELEQLSSPRGVTTTSTTPVAGDASNHSSTGAALSSSPTDVIPTITRAQPRWSTSVHAGLGVSRASALTPTPSARIGLLWRYDRLGVGVSALAPTWPLTINAELADARIFTSRLLGALSWRLLARERWRFDAELGIGWWRLRAVGLAEDVSAGRALTNRSEVAHSPIIVTGISTRRAFDMSFTIGARVSAGLVTTPVQLRVATQPLGRVGAPSLGLDFFIERTFRPAGAVNDDPS